MRNNVTDSESIPGHTKKVSVIIPTHNRAETILASVNSVLSQTYQNIELIVVDDASTDNTNALIQSINDPRFIYVRLQSNSGANYARNYGISSASGDYIAFQDSDDEWLPTKIEKQVEVLDNHSDIYLVFTALRRFKNGHTSVLPRKVPEQREDMLKELLKGNFISTQTVVVKREFFEIVGVFDDKLPRLQDWDLFIRGLVKIKAYFISEPLVKVFYTSNSISANSKLFLPALCKIYEKYEHLFIEHDLVAWMSIRIASASYFTDKKISFKWFLNAIRKEPNNLLIWVKTAYYLTGLASLKRQFKRAM